MTKPLQFENKSLRLKYKCLICIWIIFWAILDLFINPKYLFQNKAFSQTYYFKSEKSFVILTSLLGLKINPGNLESILKRKHKICNRLLRYWKKQYSISIWYRYWKDIDNFWYILIIFCLSMNHDNMAHDVDDFGNIYAN